MSIATTLDQLFETHGVVLLDNQKRLEGFLKDLHPDLEREVFLLTETHAAGFVKKIREHKNIKESHRQELALQLVSTSGISINHACWAIDTWAKCIPEWGFFTTKEKRVQGTLDEVLQQHLI